jgi:ATP-binding cassette subfamily F protein 3
VQSKIKQLDKIERLEVDEEDSSAIHLRFPPSPRSGTVVVEAVGLSKSYDVHTVLSEIDIKIHKGEKVAFVGRNGEGKTTLSRIITGQLDYTGELKMGHNVKIGYFAQNQDVLLDEEKTVLETIDEVARGDIRTKIRDMLGAFLFRGDDVGKKVKVLSGGERSRLALVKLLLEPVNLLVLDEPTNHLDMRSKDILKQALIKYDGTLLLVSHDRDFLDGLVSKVFEFRNRQVKENLGGIYDFLKKKRLQNLKELEIKEKSKTQETDTEVSANKLKYIEKKEYDRNLRKLKKRLQESEILIEKIENEIVAVDKSFMEPGNHSESQEIDYDRYKELREQLNEEMEKWTLYSEELENFLKETGA